MKPAQRVALVAGGVAALLLPAVAMLGRREDVPPAYAGLSNPRAHDLDAAATGRELFQANCAMCHGAEADGHGPASVGLAPPPADFRTTDVVAQHSDAYLFYRLSDGKPGTAMPSFRGVLNEDERWAIIAYLRTLRRP